MTIWYVLTFNSCRFVPNVAFRSVQQNEWLLDRTYMLI